MDNLRFRNFEVSGIDRCKIKNQNPFVIWFTGLSGSGKSSIASLVEKHLFEMKKHTYILDGDDFRMGMCNDLGFSRKDRQENIRRAGEVAKILYQAGIIVICSFISPFSDDRKKVRNLFNENKFVEIFVNTPFEICQKNDEKGLYKQANNANIPDFTGISSPYEAPTNPEIVLDTTVYNFQECALQIIHYLKNSNQIT